MQVHVHLLISTLPDISPAALIQKIKTITARETFRRFPSLKRLLWGGALWERGYFVMTSGTGATDEMIRQYIKEQRDHDHGSPLRFRFSTYCKDGSINMFFQ